MSMSDEKPAIARLGEITFCSASYHAPTDLLELSNGDPGAAVHHLTPEGHDLLLDEAGAVVGLVVRDYQARLFDGPIEVTLPGEFEHDPERARRLNLWMPSLYGGMCA